MRGVLYQDVVISEINWAQTAANSQVKKIGKTLQANTEYKLSIKFEGFSSANMNQLSTISLWLNNSTVVDNSLLGASGFGTRTALSDGEWHTITYTPASEIAYARVIFTPCGVSSRTMPIALSSSLILSASAQFFSFLAFARASIIASISVAGRSTPR